MTAPHERLTEYEQMDRAMWLAKILMRPSDFPYGLNIAYPPFSALKEARRRMVEARWDDAVPWLDRRIAPLEAYARDRVVVDEAIAAGRCADARWLDGMAKRASVTIDTPKEMATDEHGNRYVAYYWLRDEDSPWRRIAVPAYRSLVRDMEKVDIAHAESLRNVAARLWNLMTPEERATA